MSRTGLVIALAVAAVVGLVFGFYPELDVKLVGLFFKSPEGSGFVAQGEPVLIWLRENATYLITAIALVPAIALLLKLVLPRRSLIVSWLRRWRISPSCVSMSALSRCSQVRCVRSSLMSSPFGLATPVVP